MKSLSDRMKDYETRTRYYIPRRTYTLIRIDGKAFHTYTKAFYKPIDPRLTSAFRETAIQLCQNIQGSVLAYTQSDEITILLSDFEQFNTEAWFDGNLQKIVSVSASMATAYFNHIIDKRDKLAFFDSRVWTVSDRMEAYNTFVWRQQDAIRNAVQVIGQSKFSHKQLHGKNVKEVISMLVDTVSKISDFPSSAIRGKLIYKNENGKFTNDKETPIFTENPDYLLSKIPKLNGDS